MKRRVTAIGSHFAHLLSPVHTVNTTTTLNFTVRMIPAMKAVAMRSGCDNATAAAATTWTASLHHKSNAEPTTLRHFACTTYSHSLPGLASTPQHLSSCHCHTSKHRLPQGYPATRAGHLRPCRTPPQTPPGRPSSVILCPLSAYPKVLVMPCMCTHVQLCRSRVLQDSAHALRVLIELLSLIPPAA